MAQFFKRMVITRYDADPLNPSEGELWYNTTDSVLRYQNAGVTVDLTEQTINAEGIQDVVGAMATDSVTLDFTYDDAAGTLVGAVLNSPLLDGQTVAEIRANIDAATLNGKTASQIQTDTTAAIVDSSPATLDTLNELATALGNDPNFATSITNLIATKPDKFVSPVGNGTSRTHVLTHNLDTQDILVSTRFATAPFEGVDVDWYASTANTITLTFAGKTPAVGEFVCTVIG